MSSDEVYHEEEVSEIEAADLTAELTEAQLLEIGRMTRAR